MNFRDTIGATFGKGFGVLVASGTAVAGQIAETTSPFLGILATGVGLLGSLAFLVSLCFDIDRKWRRRKAEIKTGQFFGGNDK
jgi:predicted secreted protein